MVPHLVPEQLLERQQVLAGEPICDSQSLIGASTQVQANIFLSEIKNKKNIKKIIKNILLIIGR